jgi:hypothetical protein
VIVEAENEHEVTDLFAHDPFVVHAILSQASSSSGCFFWMRIAKNDEQFKSPDRTALRAVLYEIVTY